MQGVKVMVQTDRCSYSVLLKTHQEEEDTGDTISTEYWPFSGIWVGVYMGSEESGSQKVTKPPWPLVSSTDTKTVLYLIFQTNKIQKRWSLAHTDNSKGTETN